MSQITKPLAGEIASVDIRAPAFVFSQQTAQHVNDIAELIAPRAACASSTIRQISRSAS
jgi:hypothetical protein